MFLVGICNVRVMYIISLGAIYNPKLHHANSTKLHRRLFISALTVEFVRERLQCQPVDVGFI